MKELINSLLFFDKEKLKWNDQEEEVISVELANAPPASALRGATAACRHSRGISPLFNLHSSSLQHCAGVRVWGCLPPLLNFNIVVALTALQCGLEKDQVEPSQVITRRLQTWENQER
eukprot:scaffold633_cov288-Ochromonas_danica.AAC.95